MNLERLSDNELISHMNNGEKEKAFNAFYRRYNLPLHKFCFSLSKNQQLTEELVQNTFQKLWISGESFVPKRENGFKSWLYNVAKNEFIDSYRKNKKKREYTFSEIFVRENEEGRKDIEYIDKYILVNSSSPEDGIIDNEKLNPLMALLEEFKTEHPKYFNLIDLRYFAGLSYNEIISETGFTMQNVKTSLFNAKKMLNKKLSGKKGFLLDA